MNTCQQLKQDYEALKSLKQEFDLAYQEAYDNQDNSDEAVKTEKITKARELKTQLETAMLVLQEQLMPKEIKALWENSGQKEKSEIIINFSEELARSK